MCHADNETRRLAFVMLVCGGASQTIPLSVLVRQPHRGPEREISHEIGSEREKEDPREDRES